MINCSRCQKENAYTAVHCRHCDSRLDLESVPLAAIKIDTKSGSWFSRTTMPPRSWHTAFKSHDSRGLCPPAPRMRRRAVNHERGGSVVLSGVSRRFAT